jgi:hypothetical protein
MRLTLNVAVVLILSVSVFPQVPQPPDPPTLPSANEIIRKVATANAVRTARLQSYRSTRIYEVEYKGLGSERHARMVVSASFADGRKSFHVISEEGSKLLLNRVIRKALESEEEAATDEMRARSGLTEANYTFEFLKSEVSDGRPCFVLRVLPKRKDKFLYDGKVWIDAADFAIVRVEAQPAKNPSFWITGATIEHHNVDVRGIWLPASNRSTSKVRLGGKAMLTIDYGKYEEIMTR